MTKEEDKAMGYTDEDILNLLGDLIGDMRVKLDEFVASKGLKDSSNVVVQRKEIISTLLTVYFFLSKDVESENIKARKRIREFSELIEAEVLEEGVMPTELLSMQAERFNELWRVVKEINDETEQIAKRRNIVI